MDDFAFFALALLAVVLFALVLFLLSRISALERSLSDLSFSKSSQSVKYGKLAEQFMPFTKEFPFSAGNFRFLGNPVDGVVFEDNKIVFAEFKAANSQLSEKQKRIKELVQQKKVEWFELHMK
ncbi:MAG TPA: endonuclease [Candidatus Diapherotrites archaeon]|uniref:Endonuclease n=1 Tax=Candidatus Iainarchaeum sp. TaxID=3101447 RepID=A0A7J4IUW9_9ARCH|nr:endonuclease [Candidatus Diapherotrites archaeon]